MKKRYLIREVYLADLISYFFLSLFFIIALSVGMYFLYIKTNLFYYFLAPFIILAYFLLKSFAIGVVLMYKCIAPLSVRGKCRFEPTCSTYMILSIQKYGLFRGAYKGFRRICRCKPPNGGIDYP